MTTTANVPKPIVDKLNSNIRDIMSEGPMVDLLVHQGMMPEKSPPPDELKAFVASEIVRWGKVIELAGVARSQ